MTEQQIKKIKKKRDANYLIGDSVMEIVMGFGNINIITLCQCHPDVLKQMNGNCCNDCAN